MSKLDQILVLEPPQELKFKGPFVNVVTSELKLTNPSQKQVLFKVKTTAPKCYCVRPNSGILEPGAHAIVSVMLQPFDHTTAEKSKHKFMVQSMFAPDAPFDNQDQLWKEANTSQLMDSKLKCVFDPDLAQNVNLGREEIIKPVYNKEVASAINDPLVSLDPGKLNKFVGAADVVDIAKLPKDSSSLNAEIQRLKSENESLRSEGLRLRSIAMSQTISSTPPKSVPTSQFDTSSLPGNSISPIIYLVAMLIVGILIGKLLL